jgi:hypothetical protein
MYFFPTPAHVPTRHLYLSDRFKKKKKINPSNSTLIINTQGHRMFEGLILTSRSSLVVPNLFSLPHSVQRTLVIKNYFKMYHVFVAHSIDNYF